MTSTRFDTLMGDGAILSVGGMKLPCDPRGTRTIAEEWTSRISGLALRAARSRRRAATASWLTCLTAERSPTPSTALRPTGRFANVDEMVIFRIADGKIAEAWEVYDESGMWRQLGVTPPAA